MIKLIALYLYIFPMYGVFKSDLKRIILHGKQKGSLEPWGALDLLLNCLRPGTDGSQTQSIVWSFPSASKSNTGSKQLWTAL